MTKVDISSTAVEKGIDMVKGFVEKLVGGAIEEAGLMMTDRVRLRRLKNQIKILEKAQKIAKDCNIDIKQINLKVLVPLLENCSLEEDETLQSRWANLIANYADTNKHYESTIFPFILSQLSGKEVIELEKLHSFKFCNGYENISFLRSAEISNLIRLGLIEKELPEARIEPLGLMNKKRNKISFSNEIEITITELGKEFVDCCSPSKY